MKARKTEQRYHALIQWLLSIGIDVLSRKIGIIILLTIMLQACLPEPERYRCADGYMCGSPIMLKQINRVLLDSATHSARAREKAGKISKKEADSLIEDYQGRVNQSELDAHKEMAR